MKDTKIVLPQIPFGSLQVKWFGKGTFRNYVCTKGGGGGQLGEILCKLFRLEVYSMRGEGVKNLENMQT